MNNKEYICQDGTYTIENDTLFFNGVRVGEVDSERPPIMDGGWLRAFTRSSFWYVNGERTSKCPQPLTPRELEILAWTRSGHRKSSEAPKVDTYGKNDKLWY